MGIGAWILGIVMGLLALCGLFLASGSHGDQSFYAMGLGLFLFGCAIIFILIKQSFDERA